MQLFFGANKITLKIFAEKKTIKKLFGILSRFKESRESFAGLVGAQKMTINCHSAKLSLTNDNYVQSD